LSAGLGRTPEKNDAALNEAMMRHDNAGQRVMQTRRWMSGTRTPTEGTTRLAERQTSAPGGNRDLASAATVTAKVNRDLGNRP